MDAETREYLDNLGWDSQLWRILPKEESDPLLTIPTYMNNMFEVKDMTGKKRFGPGSYVVNINWIEKHKPQPEVAVAEEVIPPPPPTPVETEVIPPPPAVEVPEKLQEVVNASPNIEIVTIAPPAKAEWPSFIHTRVASFITKGWTPHHESEDMIVSPDKEKVYGYEDIEEMSDAEFMENLRGFKAAPEPLNAEGRTTTEQADFDAQHLPKEEAVVEKTIEEKAAEASAERFAKNEAIRIQKEAEQKATQPIDNLVIEGAKAAKDAKADPTAEQIIAAQEKAKADRDKVAADAKAKKEAAAIKAEEKAEADAEKQMEIDAQAEQQAKEKAFDKAVEIANGSEEDETEGMSSVELDEHYDAKLPVKEKKQRSPKPDTSDIETADDLDGALERAMLIKKHNAFLALKALGFTKIELNILPQANGKFFVNLTTSSANLPLEDVTRLLKDSIEFND